VNENQSLSATPPPEWSPSVSEKNVRGSGSEFGGNGFAAAWVSFGS
jgi:hypothetical protein